MGILLALFVGFFAFEMLGYAVHRLLHAPWSGRLHRAHLNHHQKQYPPDDFLSEAYRGAGRDTTVVPFAVGGVLLAGLLFLWLPWLYALALVIELAVIGWINDYAHTATHLRGHWLERFKGFRRLRAMHRVHHVEMSRNLGIVTFFTDGVFGTYQDPQAKHLMR